MIGGLHSWLIQGVHTLKPPKISYFCANQNAKRLHGATLWGGVDVQSLRAISGIPYKMPKQNRRMKRKPRKTTRVSSDVGYSGPSVPRILRDDNRIDREIFTQYNNVITSPTGNPVVISSDVNLASPTGYSSFSVNYKEYRVLALRVEFVCGIQNSALEAFNNVPTTTYNYFPALPALLYTMREDLSLPTQSQWELNPTSNRLVPNNFSWSEEIKARGTIAMQWNTVGTGLTLAQVMAVKYFPGTTSTVGSGLGATKTTWLVEFRGRN